jgi:hypothetical protein
MDARELKDESGVGAPAREKYISQFEAVAVMTGAGMRRHMKEK